MTDSVPEKEQSEPVDPETDFIPDLKELIKLFSEFLPKEELIARLLNRCETLEHQKDALQSEVNSLKQRVQSQAHLLECKEATIRTQHQLIINRKKQE